MASTARRKRNYIAIIPEQKDMMVKYLAANPALSSGKFSSNFTCKIAQNHWQKLALQLNSSMRGPKKNWKEWRKTWQDMKSRVKSKNSKIRLCTDKTGGGSPPPLVVLQDKLTLLKEQMSGELIPKVSITRLTGISEKPSDATTSVTTVPELIPFSEKKHPPAEEPKKNVNRSSQGQRATDVAVTTTKQVTSKEDYYTRKLVLLERLAAAEERKAAAEERKADLLSTLLEKNFPLFR